MEDPEDREAQVDIVARSNAEAKASMLEAPACQATPQLLVPDEIISRQSSTSISRVVKRVESLEAIAVDETYLGIVNWEAVYKKYAETASPRAIAVEVNLSVKQVEHILEHGIQRLGLPGIRHHALDLNEIQRIIGRYRAGLESDIDPEVQASVEDRAAREVLASQSALDSALEASGAVHAMIHQLSKKIMQGGIHLPDTVTPALLEKVVKIQEMNTRAIDRAVQLSQKVSGRASDTILIQVATLVAQCSPDEIAEAARNRQIPASIRRGSLGFSNEPPPGHGDTEEGTIPEDAQAALDEWERGREIKGTPAPEK